MRKVSAIGLVSIVLATSGCSAALDVGDYVGVSSYPVAACLAVVRSDGARESAGPTRLGPPTSIEHDSIRVVQAVLPAGLQYEISGRTVYDFDGDLDIYSWECSVEVDNETMTLTAQVENITLG